jgi:hypothetical protein
VSAAMAAAMLTLVASPMPSLSAMSKAEAGELIRGSPIEALLMSWRAALKEMGTYRARMLKQERIDGELQQPQTLAIHVRQEPHAVFLRVVSGPGAGRMALYNPQLRKGEMRAREAGLLGLVGGVWLSLDSKLARRDTNHVITDIGFGPIIDLIERDFHAGQRFGGHARKDEGYDGAGAWCIRLAAPPGASGLYAQSCLMCIDPAHGVPTRIEVFSASGLKERFEFSDVRPKSPERRGDFTPEGMGL